MSSRPTRSTSRKRSGSHAAGGESAAAAADPAPSPSEAAAAPSSTSASAAAQTTRRKERLRSEFQTLDKEMELVGYGTNEKGQRRRKMPRKQSLYRTKKRKVLEKEDVKERAIEAEEIRPKRLRGSRVAFEDEVVKGSMIFGADGTEDGGGGGSPAADDDEKQSEQLDDHVGVDNDDSAADQEEEGASATEPTQQQQQHASASSAQSTSQSSTGPRRRRGAKPTARQQAQQDDATKKAKDAVKSGKSNISRVMYRLKNFKSHKLAERQGLALGAHARGEHKDAIRQLGEVASAAPLAPQVYSTLGLVYENMLREQDTAGATGATPDDIIRRKEAPADDGSEADGGGDGADQDTSDEKKSIQAKLEIAKKAYGSYHIAAVMCKKDFTLWVRAADAALEIADMYSSLLNLISGDTNRSAGDDNNNYQVMEFKAERKKWTEEAKNDYQAADNLQPPGISIPAKLASVEMELGNLSEALTILTDLKNQAQNSSKTTEGERTELDRSYGAWLLYADLMLRIGHECRQWNDGIQSNENYMFRRWLRRYCESFDWKERRLQALCMALEAAAGSFACAKLIEWFRDRASTARHGGDGQSKGATGAFESDRWKVDTYESDHKEKERQAKYDGNDDSVGKSSNANATGKEESSNKSAAETETPASEEQATLESAKAQFEKDRESLLSNNRAELLAFDQELEKMNLEPSSQEAKDREQMRAALVKKHRSDVVTLVGDYHQKKASAPHITQDAARNESQVADSSIPPLPMSASCATVCDIAALLMKQCIDLGLYHGCSLVGEAVSSYMKERVSRRERRSRNSGFNDNNPLQNLFQMHASYDDVDAGDASDSEDSVIDYISDDEDLESPSKEDFIEVMRNGALPNELKVLCGISMIGEGGKNYAAQRVLSAIAHLDTVDPMETDGVEEECDRAWTLFSRSIVGPTNKSSALALIADLVDKMGEDKLRQSLKLIELFGGHIEDLQKEGQIDDDVVNADIYDPTDALGQRKCQYMKVIHALLKLHLCRVEEESLLQTKYSLGASMALLDFVIRFEDMLWTGPAPGGTIAPSDVKLLKILFQVFSMLLKASESSHKDVEIMNTILAKMGHLLSLIFRVTIAPSIDETDAPSFETETHFPLSSDWQSPGEQALTQRTFNMCMGYAVPVSMGWKDEEFCLQSMMKSNGSNFFGIKVEGKVICGIIPEGAETEMASQLQLLQEILVDLPASGNFQVGLSNIKKAEWYTRAIDKLNRYGGRKVLSLGGEEDGIMLLLQLSKLCLVIAKALGEGDAARKRGMMKTALSIIVPITQFCTGRQLWTSRTGISNASETDKKEWDQFIDTRFAFEGMGSSKSNAGQESKRRRKPSQPPKIRPSKSAKETKKTARQLLLSGAIELSSSAMLLEWLKQPLAVEDGDAIPTTRSLSEAKQAMSKLDEALWRLQKSTTLHAMQKTSISVATSLLEVASQIECHNIFACLQHAVMFASHGPKLGKSDLPFKKALPTNDLTCSPQQALLVLGRADCLRALHFTDEATFLCSHILRICRLRRQSASAQGSSATPLSPRWGAVNAYAYLVSVAIESTFASLLDACGKTTTVSNWDSDALADIEQGKADAIRICGVTDINMSPTRTSSELEPIYDNNADFGDGLVADSNAFGSGEIVDEGIWNEAVDGGSENLMEFGDVVDSDGGDDAQEIEMVAV